MGLRDNCIVNNGSDGDDFVGVRFENDDVFVRFPLGFKLSNTEAGLRSDIRLLCHALSLAQKTDTRLANQNYDFNRQTIFPFSSYIYLIEDFLDRGSYFVEPESYFDCNNGGKIHWRKTIKTQNGYLQPNGDLIFQNFVSKKNRLTDQKFLTMLHKYCVYVAFSKFGWLYTDYLPEKMMFSFDRNDALGRLSKAMERTYKDRDLRLFRALYDVINNDSSLMNLSTRFLFGTTSFEHVWEDMIDALFCNQEKDVFFPKTRYVLKDAPLYEKSPLIPDSIMSLGDSLYVIDSKYYRFGVTGLPSLLPNGSDINKQITYGEYAYRIIKNTKKVFNCFVLPFSSENNPFGVVGCTFYCPGYGVGLWRKNNLDFEKVTIVLADAKKIMKAYVGESLVDKYDFAKVIQDC